MKKKKPGIKEENILKHLEELAEGIGISVRYEQLKKEGAFFPGGLCRVKDEDMFIINSRANIDDKIDALTKGLATFDLDQVFVRPVIRELIDREAARLNEAEKTAGEAENPSDSNKE